MIKEIAFTMYAVTDLGQSRKFYEEVLGLQAARDFGEQWVEYDLGPSTFALSTYGTPSPQGASIAFEVDDFDETLARLREGGVEFEGEPIDTPVCRIALVRDPDRNQFIIHKRKEGH
jgi:predicted enzyme related to lactoylglutathione lyase